jgi:Zn-dependent protease with chaperone function
VSVVAASDPGPVRVEPWPSEAPLLVGVAIAAVFLWLAIAISILGLFYALLIGIGLFFARLVFIAHIRGNGVRLGPQQLPELYARVVELARAAGVSPVPEAYVTQEGGALNAFATRFFRARIIVLYSDLLDACEGDPEARDMVIGHELGHIKAGHLNWHWLLAPGMIMPFLGNAYSRAREYTCDRWGRALCGSSTGAVRGLSILAAGGRLGRRIDPRSFVGQGPSLDGGLMTLGRWLSNYPPLCDRVGAMEPSLGAGIVRSGRGALVAIPVVAAVCLLPVVVFGGIVAAILIPNMISAIDQARQVRALSEGASASGGYDDEAYDGFDEDEYTDPQIDVASATVQVGGDLDRLESVLRASFASSGVVPSTVADLSEPWALAYPGEELPIDPFDGQLYGLTLEDEETPVVLLWSSGPDGEGSDDSSFSRRVHLRAER